jgi:predicted NBD/HSP70 family sugar kinase/predicted DNA-binding transcriptional regulator
MTTPDAATDKAARQQSGMRGSSQTGVRLYNERLVLSLVRTHSSLPKAEIARLTGLSPQTVSVIVRQLEKDGFLRKGVSQKGKVGQPLQPFSLSPEGTFSIGLKVGRRSGDLVLVGLDGVARKTVHHPYHFPTPEEFMRFARLGIDELLADLSPSQRKRISGMGVAAPFDIWKWEEEAGATPGVLEAWKRFDLTAELAAMCEWPVIPCNDATAACAAELLLGRGRQFRDFAYFYVGYFIGGGVVLNGHVFNGPKGNAGAFASIPVQRTSGGTEQLVRSASLYLLERQLRDEGRDSFMLWQNENDWSRIESAVERWVDTAARGIAQAAAAIAAVIDPAAIIIDGAMPPHVRSQLVAAVRSHMARVNTDGISPFAISEGTIGIQARALGAASLPLFANFMVDRDVLLKEEH